MTYQNEFYFYAELPKKCGHPTLCTTLSLTYLLTRSFEGLLYRTNKEEFKKVRVP